MLLERRLSVHLPRYDTAKVKARKHKVQRKRKILFHSWWKVCESLKMLLGCKEQEVEERLEPRILFIWLLYKFVGETSQCYS